MNVLKIQFLRDYTKLYFFLILYDEILFIPVVSTVVFLGGYWMHIQ